MTGQRWSNIPKYIFWLSICIFGIQQTANIKLKIEISSFKIVTDQKLKIKICILPYLIGQRQSNIPKCIFWFSKTWKSKYAFWNMSNCKLKLVVLDFWQTKTKKSKDIWQTSAGKISHNAYSDFAKLENQIMRFEIFDWLRQSNNIKCIYWFMSFDA